MKAGSGLEKAYTGHRTRFGMVSSRGGIVISDLLYSCTDIHAHARAHGIWSVLAGRGDHPAGCQPRLDMAGHIDRQVLPGLREGRPGRRVLLNHLPLHPTRTGRDTAGST